MRLPYLGECSEWLNSRPDESPWQMYERPGVSGLARPGPDGVLEVLAITATVEGDGRVGRFLDELKLYYTRVTVFEVWSVRLHGMLVRRGWRADEFIHDALTWERPTPK